MGARRERRRPRSAPPDSTRPGRRGYPTTGRDRAASCTPAGPEIRPRCSARPRAAWCGQNVHWGADDLRVRGGEPEGRGDGEQPQSHPKPARGGCGGRRRARTHESHLPRQGDRKRSSSRADPVYDLKFRAPERDPDVVPSRRRNFVAVGTSRRGKSVDILFVDEAAQVCLANLLAVSQAAPRIVLLGDPQQLDQPMQGSHPDGTAVSAMNYLLAGEQTVSDERGIFVEETWRLHPRIAAFTSELFYEGRIRSRDGLDRQEVRSRSHCSGAGLIHVPV